MTKQISKKSGTEIIARQGSLAMVGIIGALTAVNPTWGVLFAIVSSAIGVWGEFGQARTQELVEFLTKHKDEFIDEILKSERFKSVFVNILDRQIREVSEEKRQLFRTYLLNMGKGLFPDFNMDSKLLSILDQITPEELKVLEIWNGRIQRKIVEKNPNIGYTMENIEQKMKESELNEHQVMFAFEGKDWPSMDELTFILRSLGNYGLLDTRESSGVIRGDGSDGIRVKRISPFGKIFLQYITEQDQHKKF